MRRLKLIRPATAQEKLLAAIRKESAAEIHPSLLERCNSNNYFELDLFAPLSKQLMNWTCKKGHPFVLPILRMTLAIENGSIFEGCPVCSGRIPPFEDSLAATFPDLAQEWLTLRNNDMDPREIHPDWEFLAYWQCSALHSFRTQVSARTANPNPQGCPSCFEGPRVNLSEIQLEQIQFEQSELNHGFDPGALPEEHLVFWHCAKENHLFYQSVTQLRDRDWQCSICQENNCKYLGDLPELMKQLVSIEGNVTNLALIHCGSHKKAMWQCPAGVDHTWTTPLYRRALKHEGCPFCENRRPSVTNSLANFPDLATELHPHKNGGLTAATVVARTKRILWWLCSGCGHEWEKAAFLRTLHCSPCPKCKSRALRRKRRQELQAISQDKAITQKAAE
jgi:hypothetical protein